VRAPSAENLRVKEVAVAHGGTGEGDQGARAQRLVVCHNPEQADRDAAVRYRLGRVGRPRGGYAFPTLGRSGSLSWCSDGLTGAEVPARLTMGVRGLSLETDPRDEVLDWAELAVCLDIIGAAAAVRGKVLNGVVLHAGVAGPVQRPKAHFSLGHVPPVE